ncbi:ABC transporter substrate binding protein [Neptunomonas sp.]|uniref:ABC transporter substrate-binding protein n=1 Tax=Neptunomonas sp. TaxID=1971898 RepID=UPI0025FB236E|nr:ABC transporter substrate binding protein [Neptunomonas sp.]
MKWNTKTYESSLIAIIIWLFGYSIASAATLAVLYPEVKAPYKQIFEQILDGIASQHDERLLKVSLGKKFNKANILADMEADNVEMVITLGRRSYSFVSELKDRYPFVSGALPLAPNGISGVSLIADPETLFIRLNTLAPKVRRVFVVYTPRNKWLIDLAQQSAGLKKIDLVSYEVTDLSQAVEKYQEILKQSKSYVDAIWLPLDKTTANEKVVLPLLLKEAWRHKIVLFSNKPSHAQRGALFSIYPDNKQSGVRLAQMVQEIHQLQNKPGVEPLKSLKVGVNLRTSAHLGLEYSQEQIHSFYVVFPTP